VNIAINNDEFVKEIVTRKQFKEIKLIVIKALGLNC